MVAEQKDDGVRHAGCPLPSENVCDGPVEQTGAERENRA